MDFMSKGDEVFVRRDDQRVLELVVGFVLRHDRALGSAGLFITIVR